MRVYFRTQRWIQIGEIIKCHCTNKRKLKVPFINKYWECVWKNSLEIFITICHRRTEMFSKCAKENQHLSKSMSNNQSVSEKCNIHSSVVSSMFEIFNFPWPKNHNIFGGKLCPSLYIKLIPKTIHCKLIYSQKTHWHIINDVSK